MARRLRVFAIALAVVLAMACGPSLRGPRTAPPRLPDAKARVPQGPPPAEWFWQDVPTAIRPATAKPLSLPLAEADLGRPGHAWDELGPEARSRLLRDGVVVVGAPKHAVPAIGAFHEALREQRTPGVVTIDELVTLAMLGIERALAAAEDTALAPALVTFLGQLDARLAKESRGAATELGEGYRVARGLVGVARALAGEPVPPDQAALVAGERARIEGTVRTASPLLGVPLDPADFVVPTGAAHPGAFRALAWLAAAPLGLVGKGEAPGAVIDIAQARANARAAMLLARVCDQEVDPAIHASYMKIQRWLGFVWGAPDDLTLDELDALATAAGVDLTKPENLVNVTRIDRVRARARAGRIPALRDEGGAIGRAGIGVRLFGGHAALDAIALQSLLAPAVGKTTRTDLERLARDGQRRLPATLDLVAWLGLPEAHALVTETHVDAFAGYGPALDRAEKLRPDAADNVFHASVQGSLLDVLVTWAGAREGAGFGETAGGGVPNTAAAARMRAESILAAFGRIRHAATPLARGKGPTAAPTGELRVSGTTPMYVEPLPEVVARLEGAIGQLRRGLGAQLGLVPTSPAIATLVEIEDILQIARRAAEHHVGGEVLAPEEAAALASLPARFARLEGDEPLGPGIALVASDPDGDRVLASATGPFEPVYLVVRDAEKEAALLAVGLHLAHHELVGPPAILTDAAWRATLEAEDGEAGARPSWVDAFRVHP